MSKKREEQSRPQYSGMGYDEVRSEATGYFRVEELDGVWWLIDPTGRCFFAIGTDHVNYHVHWCEKLGYAPYHRNVAARYGSESAWASSSVERLKRWGFNALGSRSSYHARYQGLPHPENLRMGAAFARRANIVPPTRWTGFPDVFSPEFEAFCDEFARERCTPHADDPWLLGWFIDNELEWHHWTTRGLLYSAMNKISGHPAKVGLVQLLRRRHPDAASFNAAWGTSLDDLSQLAQLPSVRPAATKAAEEDEAAFKRLVAERYFSVTTGAIRRHDPNHLILGFRFAGQAGHVWDIAGEHCDIVSVNCYRELDVESGEFTDGFPEQLDQWHRQAQRPMMVTEWSFPALDAGLPCKHGGGQRVPTQTDRAKAFRTFQEYLFSRPYMVGSNYFMWADEPALGISRRFPEDSNYGLVNVEDEPYEELTRAARDLNSRVCEIHRRSTASD